MKKLATKYYFDAMAVYILLNNIDIGYQTKSTVNSLNKIIIKLN